jgi:hypothetical protein
MPIAAIDVVDFRAGCIVTVRAPLGRATFQATEAQITAWETAHITAVEGCVARVQGGAATNATTIALTMSRAVAADSVLANGSQFQIAGLAVTAAAVSGRVVTLTTAAQTPGASYSVTVAPSVLDIFDDAFDATTTTVAVSGYQVPAAVLINEVHPNLTSSCDLVELLVTQAGTLEGLSIEGRDDGDIPVQALPPIVVGVGDLVVIHLNGESATCNPAGSTFETAVGQFATTANFSAAFDVYLEGTLTGTNGVVMVSNTAGIVDAVPYASTAGDACNSGAASRTAFDLIVAASHWVTAEGSAPTTPSTNTNFCVDSAGGSTFATGVTGNSLQRLNRQDANRRTDWSVVPGTMGAINDGQ